MDDARCIPILASLDLDTTLRFYTEKLGFNVAYADKNTLIVKRDKMEIHFWLSDNRQHPENTSCYIRGGQVEHLYQIYLDAKVPRLSTFEVRPWNMKEFYIHDPHGNLLKFGMSPEETTIS